MLRPALQRTNDEPRILLFLVYDFCYFLLFFFRPIFPLFTIVYVPNKLRTYVTHTYMYEYVCRMGNPRLVHSPLNSMYFTTYEHVK